MRDPHLLHFARPIVHYPRGLRAELVEAGLVRLPDDGTGLRDWLAGQPHFPEAFATSAARDLRLGREATHIEFIPTTWVEAEEGGFTAADIAVGPRLGDDDFDAIAGLVIAAKLPQLRGLGHIEVVVNRVSYEVSSNPAGSLTICAVPLYSGEGDWSEIEPTMDWVLKAFAAGLAGEATAGDATTAEAV